MASVPTTSPWSFSKTRRERKFGSAYDGGAASVVVDAAVVVENDVSHHRIDSNVSLTSVETCCGKVNLMNPAESWLVTPSEGLGKIYEDGGEEVILVVGAIIASHSGSASPGNDSVMTNKSKPLGDFGAVLLVVLILRTPLGLVC